jgi:hypothetical protein
MEDAMDKQLKTAHRLLKGFLLSVLVLITIGQAFAEGDGNRGPSYKVLGALAANPVSYLRSVSQSIKFDFGAPNGNALFLNTIPTIPVKLGNWDAINRVAIPLIDVPGFIAGTPEIPVGAPGDGAFGLGDINYSLFLSPGERKKYDWGLGPSITFDTASDPQLGSGKWSIGPTAAFFYVRAPWAGTMLGRQLWSFAGDSHRADVNQFLLQNIVLYAFGNGWGLVSDLTITSNWNADSNNRWTVPLGGGIAKMVKVTGQPIQAKLQASYNVIRPDGAPKGAITLTVRFLFPE